LLYLSLYLALLVDSWGNLSWNFFYRHLFPFTILYLSWLIVFYISGLYELALFRKFSTLYVRILTALLICAGLGVFFFYLFPFFGITPKTNLALTIAFFGILTVAWRNIFSSIFASHFQNKVAIIGRNAQAEELSQIIQNNPHLGYKFIAFLDPQEDVLWQIQTKKPDILILAENIEPRSPLVETLYRCLPLKIDLIDLAQAFEIICEKIPITFINQIWFLENLKERKREFYEKLKRLIDVISSFLILFFTSPLWLIIALAIKLEDGGPIFYFQKRVGKDRKSFSLIKFRSMKVNAEEYGAIWAEKNDPRITKIGKILRQSHLDELPQMINILKGEISLVGPRPERPEFVSQLEKEIPYYHLRHLIKPGFTGWAQIKFRYARSVMDSFEKFQYDLYYLKNRSFFLDLKILLKTFNLFFKKE